MSIQIEMWLMVINAIQDKGILRISGNDVALHHQDRFDMASFSGATTDKKFPWASF
jgi:hypothetical protein